MKFDNFPNSRIKVATFFINQFFYLIHNLPYILIFLKILKKAPLYNFHR